MIKSPEPKLSDLTETNPSLIKRLIFPEVKLDTVLSTVCLYCHSPGVPKRIDCRIIERPIFTSFKAVRSFCVIFISFPIGVIDLYSLAKTRIVVN